MKIKLIVAALLLITLTGCAASGSLFEKIQKPEQKNSVVYLIREGGFAGSAYCPTVKVNEAKLGCLKMNGYIRIEVPSGKNEICFCKSVLEMGEDFVIELDLQNGEIRFFEWIPQIGEFTAVGGNVYATGGEMESVLELDSSIALEKLKKLKNSR